MQVAHEYFAFNDWLKRNVNIFSNNISLIVDIGFGISVSVNFNVESTECPRSCVVYLKLH